MANIAIIPAAGSGSRMGAGINKQYLLLGDRPVLARTVAAFARHGGIDRICLVSPADEIDYCRRDIVERYALPVAAILPGGAERQDSVRNGLEGCGAADDDLVLIHDGARPFIEQETISAALAAAAAHGACAVGVPVKDTIKRVVAGMAVATPDRSELWQVQTPQVFRFDLIRSAHRRAAADGLRGTDDAVLVESLGHPVALVRGSYRNIKITTPEDLIVAAALLAAQGETP